MTNIFFAAVLKSIIAVIIAKVRGKKYWLDK